ncbi:MAG: flagellar basal body rod protein FlgC [Hyphomicrobium sp.]
MVDDLSAATKSAWSGLTAQSARLRIVSENMANVESTGPTPGSDPYRRKTISFAGEIDRATGAELVEVDKVQRDESSFRLEHRPGHPAADERGFVKLPNVNPLIELSDMREAVRAYTANTQVIKQVREMTSMTIDLLKG